MRKGRNREGKMGRGVYHPPTTTALFPLFSRLPSPFPPLPFLVPPSFLPSLPLCLPLSTSIPSWGEAATPFKQLARESRQRSPSGAWGRTPNSKQVFGRFYAILCNFTHVLVHFGSWLSGIISPEIKVGLVKSRCMLALLIGKYNASTASKKIFEKMIGIQNKYMLRH